MSLNSARSAGSGQRSNSSKRSLNNSNSSSNKKSCKSSAKQKTLGVAWGANSISSSRSSFRSSPFSNFSSYMSEKNRKLHEQFSADASCSSHGGSSSEKLIFHGVTIFVDGFTVPSSQELRGYMLKYGGRFENYFSRHSVTHIICSNLPDSKIKNLRSFSGGLPVVKPAWILDSVVANKLLSWLPYQLDQLANNQPKLSAFFAPKSSSVSEDSVVTAICPANLDPSLKGGTSNIACSSDLIETVSDRKQHNGECSGPEHKIREQNGSSERPFEAVTGRNTDDVQDGDIDQEDIESAIDDWSSPPHQLSASMSSYVLDQNMKGSSSSVISGSSNPHHSTLGDPNFVENYFKSSRLHFIGTWRNRYRKRFPSLSSELKRRNSNLDTSDNPRKTTIIHVDMDCFFVSVVIRNHPELHDKPVAVCHSNNPKGTAEISSANYPARSFGVKAGMFVRDAKSLCPHLVIVPYNFQAYEEVADQFYDILHKHCSRVQAVSCDEAFLDITDSGGVDPEGFASAIREEILETTQCTASVGIGENMLIARLATRTAKPNGQCYIPSHDVDEYLHQLPIKTLPGIGHVLEEKLKTKNIWTCGDLQLISKDSLQKDFGIKTGEMLWNYSRGIDNRAVGVIQESKSIGAEVNWGVRFRDFQDSQRFLLDLCREVSLRLQGCGAQGRTFTLKIKKRRKDAEEPVKYMGCGDCENLSHSVTIPVATDNVEVLHRISKQLFGHFHLDIKEIRGVGLQVSKLENTEASKQGLNRNSLRLWLRSASATTEEKCNMNSTAEIDNMGQNINNISGQSCSDQTRLFSDRDNNVSTGEGRLLHSPAPPPLCDLDTDVLESLPPELFSELNGIYGGKLIDYIGNRRGMTEIKNGSCTTSSEGVQVAMHDNQGIVGASDTAPANTNILENEANQYIAQAPVLMPASGNRSSNEAISSVGHGISDLMPSSLSQVDTSVLQQLPEELRVDILELLPAHRRQVLSSNGTSVPLAENACDLLNVKKTMNPPILLDTNDLWAGNPPRWVDKFKASNCRMLNTLAEMFYRLGSIGSLSSIFQAIISECVYPLDEGADGWDAEVTNSLCELLKQYIKLKIQSDIEEIYICFRLLRRLMTKSKCFVQPYNIVFPFLQASFGENYGGHLNIPFE